MVDMHVHDTKETHHDDSHLESNSSSSLSDLPPPPPPESRRLFWIFIVNKNIGYLNLISYLIACFLTICLVAYLSIVQPFVLTVILRITENTGNLTGSLALYDEIFALPSILLWGVLSDRIGRRPVYCLGFILLGTAVILYSYVENVYPHMLLCRLLFSLGSAAATCMMTGTLSDIAGGHNERGRVSAVVGMFSGFGGLTAGMALINLPYEMGTVVKNEAQGIRLALCIVGGTAIVLSFIFMFTMPNSNVDDSVGLWTRLRTLMSKDNDEHEEGHSADKKVGAGKRAQNKVESLFVHLKYGILAGRDPRVALAYVSSFVARADTVLFTSYVSLWVIHHYLDIGWCRERNSCGAASGDTHQLTGLGQGISLAFAPLFGYAGEKFKKSTVLGVAGLIGAVGSIPFAFTKEAPAHKSNYAFVCLVGIGQIGMIVTGMTMLNGTYVDPKYRGSVAGVFSFCGAISIMIMVKLGGYLFDVWMRGAPFVLMGIAHGIVALFSIYVRIVTPRLEKRDRELFALEKAALEKSAEEESKTEFSSN